MTDEFVRRIDRVLSIVQARQENGANETTQLSMITYNFETIKESYLTGNLPPSPTGMGFGAGRAISESGLVDSDPELSEAIDSAEEFFRTGA